MFFKLLKQELSHPGTHALPNWRLAAAAHPGCGFSARAKQAKMLLRMLFFLRYHRQVVATFAPHPLRAIPTSNPRILEKIYRQYLLPGISISHRLDLFQSHYRFVYQLFNQELIDAIHIGRNLPLASIDLACGRTVWAKLAYLDRFEKEGEMTLGLYDEEGRRLYSATLSFIGADAAPTVAIGCLIGPGACGSDDGEDDAIRYLTKGTHGLRPQNLVFYLVQAFCRQLGAGALHAVATDSHIYAASARRRHRIKFDYDRFWEEVGGARLPGTPWFSLPLQTTRRSYDEMRSNKRAIYQRRYAFLDDLDTQIQAAFGRTENMEEPLCATPVPHEVAV